MLESGDYPGPSPDDYANVTALNTAFIRATLDLKGPQCGRLAAAPFLLFSLREPSRNGGRMRWSRAGRVT